MRKRMLEDGTLKGLDRTPHKTGRFFDAHVKKLGAKFKRRLRL